MSQGFLSFRSARSAGLALVCFYLFCTLGSAVTVTLSEDPAYETLRPCAQSCFFAGVYDRVANALGCTTDPDPENACYCRPDLQSAATGFLEDCVDESCGQNMDVTSALSIYSAYCSRNNFDVASTTPGSTPTSLPINSDSENISTTSTRTGTTSPSPAQTDEATNADSGNVLNAGDIAGIVVGVLGFIGTVIAAWFGYKTFNARRQASRNHMDP